MSASIAPAQARTGRTQALSRGTARTLVVSLASLLAGCGENNDAGNESVAGGGSGGSTADPSGGGIGGLGGAGGQGALGGMGPVGGSAAGATGGLGGAGATGGGTGATGGLGGTGATGGLGGTGATGGQGGTGGVGGTGATGGTTGGDTSTTGAGGAGSTDTETTDGTGDETSTAGETSTGDDTGAGGGEFTHTSGELAEGEDFPEAHTCSSGEGAMGFGNAISLMWSGFPAETQSFALVMLDVTLTESGGQFASFGYHSAFWNLPVSETSLPVGSWAMPLQEAGAEALSSGYLGPCPVGLQGAPEPPHTYVFTLYAMGEPTVSPGNSLDADFVQVLEDAAIAKTTLSGISCASQMGWQACGM